ncbi:MAG TPA: flagellin [Blastocatellia bacterium]|nr:flagellin [Blastocatellia bacterium]
MPFSLLNNLGSLSSQSRLESTGARLNSTIQKLSSGLRINSSGDDAAGLAIANKFRSDITVLNQGVRNANDGISALQIVDGGLNTISNLLDRASTLAAQSASDTFSGNRDTLQAEFSKVVGEITRQSQNIGLTSGGSNNKALTTIIGGGSDSFATVGGNNGVQVDLSGSANQVDATALGINSLNIGNGTGSVTGNQAITTLAANETITFQTVGSSGQLTSTSVALSAGATGSNVIDAINNNSTLKAAGVTASLDSSNKLVLSSSSLFTVSSSLADGANQTGIGGAGAAANDVAISGAANKTTLTVASATAAGSQSLSFGGSEIGYTGSSYNVSFTTSSTAATGAANAAAAVNNDLTLRSKGVFAIVDKAAGNSVSFISAKGFNLGVSNDATAGANNNLTAQNPTAATAGTTTGGATGAKSALDAIKTAVATLGKVQGTVGAGQNRLLQAVDLATSQINNFQAAESRIRDADVSAEASQLSRLSVLQQAGVAALAQANQTTQAVLSLLR